MEAAPLDPKPAAEIDVLEAEFDLLHGRTAESRDQDGSPEERLRRLRKAIHSLPPGFERKALCLSGGGIRSATYCLGVLQGLARRGLLEQFHYLSTVSGGGYIGSWLTAWIARNRDDVPGVLRELGDEGGTAGPIRRLRACARYLSPTWGLSGDLFALVGTFLRNLALHWAVLVPFALAVLLVPRIYYSVLSEAGSAAALLPWLLSLAGLSVAVAVLYAVADAPDGDHPASSGSDHFNRLFFAPSLIGAVALSVAGFWLGDSVPGPGPETYVTAGSALALAAVTAGVLLRGLRGLGRPSPRDSVVIVLVAVVIGGVVGLMVHGAGAAVADWKARALEGPLERYASVLPVKTYAVVAVPAILGCLWALLACLAGLLRGMTGEATREWLGRAGGRLLAAGLAWLFAFGLVLLLPAWCLFWLPRAATENLSSAAGVAAIATSLIGYWSRNGPAVQRRVSSAIASLGLRTLDVAALLSGVAILTALGLMLSRVLSPDVYVTGFSPYAFDEALSEARPGQMGVLVAGLLGVGAILSSLLGVNSFSLHGLYGNRLVRTFLGSSRDPSQRRPHWFTGFDPNDNLPLTNLSPGSPGNDLTRLYHVFNTTLNDVGPVGGRQEWSESRGRSFVFTPLYSGSAETGFVPTGRLGERGVSVGKAVAVSGAAATPNMGYHTSPVVSFLMAVFNIRLGWWQANPARPALWRRDEPRLGLNATLADLTGQATRASAYVYLSDGGHFDNLGLYEMVRRRCREIVVVDASCDPRYEYEDLENAIRRIKIDLGVGITFPGGRPGASAANGVRELLAVGTIDYPDADGGTAVHGRLYYLKAQMFDGLPLDVERYAARHQSARGPFPHQSTADQFFDEAQFESYRALGLESALRAFPSGGKLPEAATVVRWAGSTGPGAAPKDPKDGSAQPGGAAPSLLQMIAVASPGSKAGALLSAGLLVGATAHFAGSAPRTSADEPPPRQRTEIPVAECDPSRLESLVASLSDLREVIERAYVGAGPNEELTTAIGKLDVEIRSLRTALADPAIRSHLEAIGSDVRRAAARLDDVPAISSKVSEVRSAIAELKVALTNGKGGPILDEIQSRLVEIEKRLKAIDDDIAAGSPRRNARGAIPKVRE